MLYVFWFMVLWYRSIKVIVIFEYYYCFWFLLFLGCFGGNCFFFCYLFDGKFLELILLFLCFLCVFFLLLKCLMKWFWGFVGFVLCNLCLLCIGWLGFECVDEMVVIELLFKGGKIV